jgi:molybdopterin molybdotransferase
VGVAIATFIRPAIETLLGIDRQDRDPPFARLDGDLPANDERQDYLRARLSGNDGGRLTATPLEKQDSSMLAALAAADCLIVRAPHAPPAVTGERIQYLSLRHGTLSL